MIFLDGYTYLLNDLSQLPFRSARCRWTARGYASWELFLPVLWQDEVKIVALSCKSKHYAQNLCLYIPVCLSSFLYSSQALRVPVHRWEHVPDLLLPRAYS